MKSFALRILHTADNHIGIPFAKYPDRVRERLVEERFLALERLVETANTRGAHFLVMAGDLFDKTGVTKKQVERTVKILSGFDGGNVLVLAGNHDFCEGADSKLWKTFRDLSEGSCVIPLVEQGVKDFEVEEGRIRFYACPCPSKRGSSHVIGWVGGEEKEKGMLHIGIAHGNVEGFGLDDDQCYFNMTEQDLRDAQVDLWLLGHIHVPAPSPATTGRPWFFMPGIHTPDSVKCKHPGHAWWIELEMDGSCKHEQLTCGGVRFVRWEGELRNADEIAGLQRECEALDGPNTVLDLQLSGRLSQAEKNDLQVWIGRIKEDFLYLTSDLEGIAPILDAAAIAAKFPDRTLPHALLQALLADESHPGDAHLALEVIESLPRP
jgi:DNA repair protein SbcD/Mre11